MKRGHPPRSQPNFGEPGHRPTGYWRSWLGAMGIILAALAGRAAMDKLLAWRGGPEAVAIWAQLQSLVELVAGVTLVGIGQGLTVLTAQSGVRDSEAILRQALFWGLGISAAAALAIRAAIALAPGFVGLAGLALTPVEVALLAGIVTVVPGLFSAHWLGLHRQEYCLLMAIFLPLPGIAAAWLMPWPAAWPTGLLAVQGLALLLAAGGLLAARRHSSPARRAGRPGTAGLVRYLPVGLAIGILSPLSMVAVRSLVGTHLSWSDAGLVQAFWRMDEWITGIAAGALAYVYLPRLGAQARRPGFAVELRHAAAHILVPVGLLLTGAYVFRDEILALLYTSRFHMPSSAARLFVLADGIRVSSWILLNGLIARGRTAWVVGGEFLSLPLFALLLYAGGGDMRVETVAQAYLATYAIYAAFNAWALCRRAAQD